VFDLMIAFWIQEAIIFMIRRDDRKSPVQRIFVVCLEICMVWKVFDPFSGCEILPAGSVDEVFNDAAKTMIRICCHTEKRYKCQSFMQR
jgi:hypothetical protein